MQQIINIRSGIERSEYTKIIHSLLKKNIEIRSKAVVTFLHKKGFNIYLGFTKDIEEDGYIIKDDENGIKILGNNKRGLLYGIGRFLRNSKFQEGIFQPGEWRGKSFPEKTLRGIYLATHFNNYYASAPLDEVIEYIKELALWGYNTIAVWFDMHHYKGISDKDAQKMISRLHTILKISGEIGLNTSMLVISNEAYSGSPENLRAEWTGGHDGYVHDLSHYRVELCPSETGGKNLILKWRREMFEAFSDINLDYLVIWPYDQGGCTCSRCAPWGCNGFLKIAEPIASLARQYFPKIKIILSAWDFDYFIKGEWEGLRKKFEKAPIWVDYILADYNPYIDIGSEYRLEDCFNEKGVPGGLPLLGFPEVSMFASEPWGGFGAVPRPDYLQSLWDQTCEKVCGGFPYSEGLFEDINKVILVQFYWDKNKNVWDIINEYISYEFSSDLMGDISEAIKLMGNTYFKYFCERECYKIKNTIGIDEAYSLIQKADKKLSEKVKGSWRWRILYLRSLIDYELFQNKFLVNEKCKEAFGELIEIYYAKNADYIVSPPVVDF